LQFVLEATNVLSALPVSTTTRPVTQLAETAVNNASTNPKFLFVAAAGSINRTVPTRISAANPKIEKRAGDRNSALEKNPMGARRRFRKANNLLSLSAGNHLT